MCIRDRIAESVGPIIEQAISAFSGLGETIMNTLGTALINLAPVLSRFVDFISQMVVGIAPLIAQLVGSLAPVIATIVTVLMNIVPVSYTHLDVYKRQALRRITGRLVRNNGL